MTLDTVVERKEQYLASSGLVKDAKKMLLDGWGEPLEITVNQTTKADIIVKSARLKAYETKKNLKVGKTVVDKDEEDPE